MSENTDLGKALEAARAAQAGVVAAQEHVTQVVQERDHAIAELQAAGATYALIEEVTQLSTPRVTQVLRRVREQRARGEYHTPKPKPEGLALGQELAQEGMARAQASHAMTRTPEGQKWTDEAGKILEQLLASREQFTSEDITKRIGPAPSPSAIGGLFKGALRRMEPAGWTQSTRAKAHGRPLRVWRGV